MLQLAQAMSRLGTESAFEVLARAKALEAKGKSVINLGIGQPDFLTPPHIVEAAVKASRDGQHGTRPPMASRSSAKPSPPTSIAASARTIDPEPASLIVPGGKVTMFFAMLMFGEPGHRDHVPEPGLPDLRKSMIDFSGATRGRLSALRERNGSSPSPPKTCCRASRRARGCIIVNSPANPTGGVVLARANSTSLVAGLERHPDVFVLISDEIYARLLYRRAATCEPARTTQSLRERTHPARRPGEDLRDDRLAARLPRLAEGADRAGHAARHQLLFLRQCAAQYAGIAALDRPAGRRRRRWSRPSPRAARWWSRSSTASPASAASSRAARSMPSQIFPAPA